MALPSPTVVCGGRHGSTILPFVQSGSSPVLVMPLKFLVPQWSLLNPQPQTTRLQNRQGRQEYTVPEQSQLAMAGPSQSFSCQKLKCSTAVGILVDDRLYIEQYIEQNPNIQKPACCRRETGVPLSCFQSYCEGQRGDMWLPGPSHCDSKTHRLPPVVGSRGSEPGWKSG